MTDLSTVVLVPTWRRSHHVGPFLAALAANHGDIPVRPLFLCNDNDDATLTAVDAEGAEAMTFPGNPATMVEKVNGGFARTTEPFVFGASDDIRILPGCLEVAHAAMTDGIGVVCVNDGIAQHRHDGALTGHCLIRRSYIDEHSGVMDRSGVVLHPGYVHYYSDLELWQTARVRGAYVSCFEARIDHPHPNDGTAPVDVVQEWSRARQTADLRTYLSRRHLWERVAV